MKIWYLLFLFPTLLFATQTKKTAKQLQDHITMSETNNDILIKKFDRNLGSYMKTYHTSEDTGKFSLVCHLNSLPLFVNSTDITGIKTFEFDYTSKQIGYWFNLVIARTTANIKQLLTTNKLNSKSTDNITTFGLGLYQRFHLFDNFFQSGKLYESIEANITYNIISNSAMFNKSNGLGLKSDFTIFYRTDAKMHYGLKFSYNLISAENSNQLAHAVTWLSLGFDFSFYL